MKLKQIILPVSLLLLFLGGCGALSALGAASRDSAALQARAQQLKAQSDELDQKMDLMRQTLETYGPLAADLGPDIKRGYEELLEKYDLVSGYVREGRELLNEAKSLHEKSLAQATDPDGETDWIEYAMLMLGGGGLLYKERRKTAKDQGRQGERLHSRLDKRKEENEDLKYDVERAEHRVSLGEKAHGELRVQVELLKQRMDSNSDPAA